MEFLDNGQIRIGIDLSMGGAIVHASAPGFANVVNEDYPPSDRWVQDYWGDTGVKDMWPYNSTQAWSQLEGMGLGPVLLESSNDGTATYTKSLGVQFDYNDNDDGHDMQMEEWITLRGPVAVVRCKATYLGLGDKSHNYLNWPTETNVGYYEAAIPGWNQPMLAGFIKQPYRHPAKFISGTPWAPDAVVGVVPNDYMHQGQHTTPENWVATVDDNGNGVGIYLPEIIIDGITRRPPDAFSGGELSANAPSYIGGNLAYGWKAGGTLEFTAYITFGSISEIRANFAAVKDSLSQLPSANRPRLHGKSGGKIHGKGGGRVSGKPA